MGVVRWVLLVSAFALALAALPPAGQAATQDIRITEGGVSCEAADFSPASRTVHRGDTVRWTNDDDCAHRIKANNDEFPQSPILNEGETHAWEVPVDQPLGTISYICDLHPAMTGQLTVANLLPSVAVTAPAANAQVSGTLGVTGTATDDTGVQGVNVTLGSTTVAATLSGTTWTATLSLAGVHGPVTLVAEALDADGARSSASVPLVANAAPRADIAAPLELNTAEDAAFGDNSTDDHQIAAWSWAFGDGNVSTARNPTHRYGARGSYNVTLNVTDDHGLANQTLRVVQVTNAKPRGDFGVAPASPGVGEVVGFTASVTDPDGTLAQLRWEFGDGATATGAAVNHTYAAVGSYVVNLTATDNEDATLRLARTVPVGVLASARPVVSLAANATAGGAPLAVRFELNGSDPDGTIASWSLDFGDGTPNATGDGPSLPGAVVDHTYLLGGTFQVVLRALDNTSTPGTANLTLVVEPGNNTPPRASFSVSPATFRKGDLVEFRDGSADADPGDRIVRWSWDFGDGTPPACCNQSIVQHRYAHAGTFTATLNVTDLQGGVGLASLPIEIPGRAPDILVAANVTRGPAPLLVGFTVNLSDEDGSVVRWRLVFGDGTAAAEGTSPPSGPVAHLYDGAGQFDATLEATDDDGLVARSAAVRIRVDPRLSEPLPLPDGAIQASPTNQRLVMRFTAASGAEGNVTARWDFGDNRTAVGLVVEHAYAAPGTYQVTLTIANATGVPIARGRLAVAVEDAAPAGQSRVEAERGNGFVRLRWVADPRAAGYQLWRSEAGGRFAEIAEVASGTNTNYTDDQVRDGVAYTYQVTFFSANGDGRLARLSQLNNTQAFRSLGQASATGFVDADRDGIGDSAAAPGSPLLLVGAVVAAGTGAALAGWQIRRRRGPRARSRGLPLTAIPGLEPEHAAILQRAGVADAAGLAGADVQELGRRTILGPRQLEGWQAVARLARVPGLDLQDAARLARAGVRTPEQLARVRPEILAPRLNPPEDPALVAGWVRAAASLEQGRS